MALESPRCFCGFIGLRCPGSGFGEQDRPAMGAERARLALAPGQCNMQATIRGGDAAANVKTGFPC